MLGDRYTNWWKTNSEKTFLTKRFFLTENKPGTAEVLPPSYRLKESRAVQIIGNTFSSPSDYDN